MAPKVFFVEKIGNFMDAGSKANKDISSLMTDRGYQMLAIELPKSKVGRLVAGKKLWKKELAKVNQGDFIVFQYPYSGRALSNSFVKAAEKRDFRGVLLIHDIESIRHRQEDERYKKWELEFFTKFEFIISHNQKMTDWLVAQGLESKIINLEIFDYLTEMSDMQISAAVEREDIVFAGNLGKSAFLTKMNLENPVSLFGINPAQYENNISYKGAFTPEALEGELVGGKFGLIWDGEFVDTCSGIFGNYMRFNNPHKTSLYLSLGLPVIIWSQAALADFVQENQIGLVVDDLNSLDNLIAEISAEDYQKLQENAFELSKKIRSGYYTNKALDAVLANN